VGCSVSRVDASPALLLRHNPVSSVVRRLAVFVKGVLLYRVSWLYCRRVVVILKYWSGLESVRVLELVARVQRVARLSRAHQFRAQTLSLTPARAASRSSPNPSPPCLLVITSLSRSLIIITSLSEYSCDGSCTSYVRQNVMKLKHSDISTVSREGTVTHLMRFWPYGPESLQLRWLSGSNGVIEHPGIISQLSNKCLYFILGTN
jgi:hypothetical protein